MENEKRAYCEIIADLSDLINKKNKDLVFFDLLKELKKSYGTEISTNFLKNLVEGNKNKGLVLSRFLKKQNINPSFEASLKLPSLFFLGEEDKLNAQVYFLISYKDIYDYSINKNGKIEKTIYTKNQDILKEKIDKFAQAKTFNFFKID